ncbi:hypothetical protein SEA_PHAYONCE_48 [Mycobacterium phage Phayonce]|uniref:Uncharacterized protein n=1 Tax=Mycobacterium phage Phayonce TaxID=1647302 RepID=A0A0F6YR27_9CAUD|nr:hypothetical protein SEA_PHAYONCE_48 [Mycobacterium phage Phayonce]AKF14408.1 hypothetical protein SEA_PHAYONCE_48 [Mycobacterium phage Phayonce]
MTLTPAEHYERADALVAELELVDPRKAGDLAHVRHKAILAELHARLAQSPWWPAIADELGYAVAEIGSCTDMPKFVDNGGPVIETRTATGDRL